MENKCVNRNAFDITEKIDRCTFSTVYMIWLPPWAPKHDAEKEGEINIYDHLIDQVVSMPDYQQEDLSLIFSTSTILKVGPFNLVRTTRMLLDSEVKVLIKKVNINSSDEA